MPHSKPLSSAGQTISADLRIEQCAITSLIPSKRNARTHSKKQIHQIAASIQEFGFTNPVLVGKRCSQATALRSGVVA
ncbi:ParB N-terminal domain-containing protein [Microvirga sp. BT689]|nr:ParB N-terminal domain-containing protein [Microvirga arvi]